MADDSVKPECIAALTRAGWRYLRTREQGRVASLRWQGRLVVFDLHMRDDEHDLDMIVEVKSFSTTTERTTARIGGSIGQFRLYHDILHELQPPFHLYLAVTHTVFAEIFATPFGRWAIQHYDLRMLSFPVGAEQEGIRWYPHPPR